MAILSPCARWRTLSRGTRCTISEYCANATSNHFVGQAIGLCGLTASNDRLRRQSDPANRVKPWEKAFTVVQWDQRGTGHTFGRYGKETPNVTLDRIAKDGLELTRYLCQKFGKRFSAQQIDLLGWNQEAAYDLAFCFGKLFALSKDGPSSSRRSARSDASSTARCISVDASSG